jgi:hypothetical protein
MTIQLSSVGIPLTTDDVRWFLRDKPEYNIILPDNVEFSTDDITRAIRFTVAKYNVLPPITAYTADTINEYVLLCGVCAILLRSEGVRQNRNEVRAQDGNIAPVNLDEKQAQYSAWADRMQQEFDYHCRLSKTEANMESCYGDQSSGYRNLGRWTT